ncbi:hypothetical protein ASD00_36555 [Ensifer sp. Root31]|nr:hypothetical protein ASD00_36555 [Ensifer sp. Root31]
MKRGDGTAIARSNMISPIRLGHIRTIASDDGQTKSISYANGVITTFRYSPTRRWLDQVTTPKGGTVLMDNWYDRDLTGKIKKIAGLTANDNWVYDYDLRGRLVSADNGGDNALDETYAYAYADNNNLTFRTRIGNYAYPAGNAVRPHAAAGSCTIWRTRHPRGDRYLRRREHLRRLRSRRSPRKNPGRSRRSSRRRKSACRKPLPSGPRRRASCCCLPSARR